ncbi:bifunctional non-homologous end joining protein LigD [Paraburkholderia sp. GAS333]|uniref:DNA ligase D n=1 Tax=Paraburkholderia sp. GAS333 TaxID=3156279 RepID=UPI003D19DD37
MNDRLDLYQRKRRFDETPEPSGATTARKRAGRAGRQAVHADADQTLSYVIQEHDARRLHYDFRLELNGTLLSWAVPKGPSLDPSVKRLAVHVEDHPVEYGSFEGEIPAGNYGAGSVIVWDRGTWEPVGGSAEAARTYAAGKLKFRLHGEKLRGGWTLVRSHMRGSGDKEQWLLIKERDDEARGEAEYDILKEQPGSVLGEGGASVGKKGRGAGKDGGNSRRANSQTDEGEDGDGRRTRSKGAGKAVPKTTANATSRTAPVPATKSATRSAARTAARTAASTAATKTASTKPAVRKKASESPNKPTASAKATRRSDTKPASSKADPRRPDIVATRTNESLRELAASPAIEGAVKARLPATFKPQLATLVDSAPAGDDWSYEIKFDGYRVLVRIDRVSKRGVTQIFTRAGNDWTAKFGKQVEAVDQLELDSAWLDGEAVVLDDNDVPSFQALQNTFDANRPQDIVIYLFDVPYLNGYDLRDVPLEQRRAILRALLENIDDSVLRFSNDFGFSADELLRSACDMSLEGIIGKRRDSGYLSGRSSSWIKLKCRRRQEFVIGGYSEPSGSRASFGALLLGVYDSKGRLNYAGRVGTGFDAALLRSVKKALDAHASKEMPFAAAPRERSRTAVHWVEPVLVAECNFAEWTSDGIVRQASFVSLRDDKPARQIVKEASRQGVDVQQETDIRHEGAAEAEAEVEAAPKKRASSKSGVGKTVSAKTTAAKAAGAKTATAKTPAAKTATAKTPATKTSATKKSNATEQIAGVRVSHPDRVIDSSTGARKIDLVRYYEAVADWMLPHLKDRPVSLVRAPEDIGGELFFQKHSQKLSIPNVTQHPGLDAGHPPLITVDVLNALVGAAQMGTVEFHTWNALVSNIEKPDRMVFDLDPDASLGWERMIEAAQLTRSLLEELGLESFCKTSGGKGLHVVVPLAKQAGWDEVKDFSQAVAQHMAATLPKYFSAKMGAQNRKQKIFVDYLRNNRGSSTVAAFSARARPGLGVSVPLSWDEVAATTAGDQWTIQNLHERLADLKKDPWAAYAKTRQRITAAMRKRLDEAQ